MANEDVKKIIRENDLFHYQVADSLGIQDSAFSRMLRKELSAEKKQEIFAVVERLKGVRMNEKK